MSKKTDKTETAEKPDPAILRRFRREVYVALTDHEVEVYGRKLAAKKAERDTLTERAKQAAAAFKGQIADVTTEVNRLAAAINDGKELRNTDVYDRLDGSQVFTHRADNGEVIDQRPATFADQQEDMFPQPDEDQPDEDFAKPTEKPAKGKKPRKKPPVN